MSYLVYKNTNGVNHTLSGDAYIGLQGGTHKLCVRTGTGANDVEKYGLTTNTSATQYCRLKLNVFNTPCYIARSSVQNTTTQSTTSSKYETQSSSKTVNTRTSSYSDTYTTRTSSFSDTVSTRTSRYTETYTTRTSSSSWTGGTVNTTSASTVTTGQTNTTLYKTNTNTVTTATITRYRGTRPGLGSITSLYTFSKTAKHTISGHTSASSKLTTSWRNVIPAALENHFQTALAYQANHTWTNTASNSAYKMVVPTNPYGGVSDPYWKSSSKQSTVLGMVATFCYVTGMSTNYSYAYIGSNYSVSRGASSTKASASRSKTGTKFYRTVTGFLTGSISETKSYINDYVGLIGTTYYYNTGTKTSQSSYTSTTIYYTPVSTTWTYTDSYSSSSSTRHTDTYTTRTSRFTDTVWTRTSRYTDTVWTRTSRFTDTLSTKYSSSSRQVNTTINSTLKSNNINI